MKRIGRRSCTHRRSVSPPGAERRAGRGDGKVARDGRRQQSTFQAALEAGVKLAFGTDPAVCPHGSQWAQPRTPAAHHRQAHRGHPHRASSHLGQGRFPNAAALQMLTGVAPVTEGSGNKHWVHWRWVCPKFLQSFVEWTAETVARSFWARACYDSHRAKGSAHNATIRALAFKWIRILLRCWVARTPYDESRYLLALQKRHSLSSNSSPRPPLDHLAVRLRA